MYLCVRVRVRVWGRRSWEKRVKKEKWKWKEKRKRKEKKEKKKRKHKLIHTDKQTHRQTDRQSDGQIDTNQLLVWHTILNNVVNQIQ